MPLAPLLRHSYSLSPPNHAHTHTYTHTRTHTRARTTGADIIECDVVLTKDLHGLCRHDVELSNTTNAQRLFSSRVATYTVDGANHTDIFAVDLTLEEVRQLRAVGGRVVYVFVCAYMVCMVCLVVCLVGGGGCDLLWRTPGDCLQCVHCVYVCWGEVRELRAMIGCVCMCMCVCVRA